MIELIAEIVCSPNRKEIYDKKVIFLTNSILDDIHFDETIYSGIDDSHDFWNDVFTESETGVFKLVLKLKIIMGQDYSHYFGTDEYYEELHITETLIKQKLPNITEMRYLITKIKEDQGT